MMDGRSDEREKHQAGEGGNVIEGLFAVVEQTPASPPVEAPSVSVPTGGGDLTVPVQEFFIPVHQFVRLTRREVEVVDHPAFQRLGHVFQLGHTFLVYRGATHQRHEHALGTLHVAQLIIESLARNARSASPETEESGPWRMDEQLTAGEVAFVRLGALLHDIGHMPAGHTFEDELGLFAKHDSLERLDMVLARTEWNGFRVESLEELVDRLYASEIENWGLETTPTELLRALIAGDYAERRGEKALTDSPSFRLSVGRDLIGNTICADLLDYLHRDLHHLGKHKEFDTRLIDYMEIRRHRDSGESRLVVYLRDGDKVRHDAVSAVLNLLESRYQLFEVALYHRTKLAATAMLERAVGEIADFRSDNWSTKLPEELLELSDFEMLAHLRDSALRSLGRARGEKSKDRLQGASGSLVALRQRRLHKKLYQRFLDQFTLPEAQSVERRYGYDPRAEEDSRTKPAANRLQALRRLEEDFNLLPLSLGMYCPPWRMSTKVAGVDILRDGDVRTLADEEARDPRLTGGHLRAQEQRFRNLWHVYFSCDRDVLEDLNRRHLRPLMIDAIDCFVLGLSSGPVSIEERAITIARALAATPESPWHGRTPVEELPIASRGAKFEDLYPTGLPGLDSFFEGS